jgi:hypothetical protein
MNDSERRVAWWLTAAVYGAFAVFWVLAIALNEPPEFPVMYFWFSVMIAIVATPWAIAARVLFRAWRRDDPDASLTIDVPSHLLTAAVASLPSDRRDWGAAMLAELSHVEGQAARWRFALGCVKAALFPPRSTRTPLVVIVLAFVITSSAAYQLVGRALPSMQLFAAAFVAFVGVIAVQTAARSQTLRPAQSKPFVTWAATLGVIASIIATGYFLVKNPSVEEFFTPIASVALAALLAGCVWMTLLTPTLPTVRTGRWLGLCAALALAVGFVVCARLSIHTMGGPIIWKLFAPGVILFVLSAVAARIGGSFRAGAEAAIWGALVGTLLIYALSFPETMHRFAIDGRTLDDGESGLPIGANLLSSIWGLVQIPIFGFPFGVFGAALGRPRRQSEKLYSNPIPSTGTYRKG